MKTGRVILLCLTVSIAIGFTLFRVGWWLGQEMANSGEGDRVVVLKEEMVVLDAAGEPKGRIPAGTKLFVVPDKYGDKTSLFKLFLQTDSNDDGPVEPDNSSPPHIFEAEIYPLKSLEWLKAVSK